MWMKKHRYLFSLKAKTLKKTKKKNRYILRKSFLSFIEIRMNVISSNIEFSICFKFVLLLCNHFYYMYQHIPIHFCFSTVIPLGKSLIFCCKLAYQNKTENYFIFYQMSKLMNNFWYLKINLNIFIIASIIFVVFKDVY